MFRYLFELRRRHYELLNHFLPPRPVRKPSKVVRNHNKSNDYYAKIDPKTLEKKAKKLKKEEKKLKKEAKRLKKEAKKSKKDSKESIERVS